ncbi:hypothetical protein FPV67DRAFT_1460914 [Lyophyllum atratum]|nr:hypothetical protein FPV67DRAFT_1460914 [Lyophyllum atratum]
MSDHISDEHIQHSAHPVESSPMSTNTLVDLTRLIQHQNQVMQDMADSSTRGMRDLLAVLRNMDDRQAAATENIQPMVDRWRGTLDTLLVFVALFSAIVTAFFIQSLTGLSENTGKRTNELLANLTDIIIMLRGADATVLDFTPAIPFKPQSSDVRLNFYWSVSLILSVSIASLTMTIRGYVARITRSRYTNARKKLVDFHLRWEPTKNLLVPAVEVLPQLLIAPIMLFVVGLLDTLLSLSLPISIQVLPILAAGIISCVFAVAVGAYTLYTVIHGCVNPSRSPFQSALASWLSSLAFRDQSRYLDAIRPSSRDDLANGHATFHSAIHSTHDDDVLDQAVAAVSSLIEERKSSPRLDSPRPSREEMQTFTYLLSSEVSVRANHAVAGGIARSLVNGTTYGSLDVQTRYSYKSEDRTTLLILLVAAAGKHPIAQWSSHFITAMAMLLACETSDSWCPKSTPSPLPRLGQAAPVLLLLLTPFQHVCLELSDKRLRLSVQTPVLSYAYEVLLSQLKESHRNLGHSDDTSSLYTAMEDFMSSQTEETLDDVRVVLQLWLAASNDSYTGVLSIPVLLRISHRGGFSIKVPLPEAFAHWIITPGMSKLTSDEVIHGVYQAVNFSRVHHLANGLEERNWIIFLCDELFTSIFQDSPQDRTHLYPTLLAICVELVLIAVGTYGSYTHPVGERARFCTVNCQVKPLIIRLLGGIRQNASNTHLDPSTWNSISSALQRGISSQDDPSWSTLQHRNEVKQEILEAFRQLAPPG